MVSGVKRRSALYVWRGIVLGGGVGVVLELVVPTSMPTCHNTTATCNTQSAGGAITIIPDNTGNTGNMGN